MPESADPNFVNKLKANYIKDEDYHPKYANGAIGGLSTRGEIVLNFYAELSTIPSSQSFFVDGGKVGKELENERIPLFPEGNILNVSRKIVSGIILNLREAKELNRWLGEQLTIAEEQLAQVQNEEAKQ